MDVALQRHGVAVIEVQAERVRVELVDEPGARHDLMLRQRAVHLRRMPSVEVNRVRVRSLVEEVDPDAIAFGRADRRPGHLAVVRPRRERTRPARSRSRDRLRRCRIRGAACRRPAELPIVPGAPVLRAAPRSSTNARRPPGSNVVGRDTPHRAGVVRSVGHRGSGAFRRLTANGRRACREGRRRRAETGKAHERAAVSRHAMSLTKYFDYSKYFLRY